MAGLTKFKMAKNALKDFDGKTIHVNVLKQLIMQELSSKESGVREYCRMLECAGVTKEVSEYQFKIDFSKDLTDPENYK